MLKCYIALYVEAGRISYKHASKRFVVELDDYVYFRIGQNLKTKVNLCLSQHSLFEWRHAKKPLSLILFFVVISPFFISGSEAYEASDDAGDDEGTIEEEEQYQVSYVE